MLAIGNGVFFLDAFFAFRVGDNHPLITLRSGSESDRSGNLGDDRVAFGTASLEKFGDPGQTTGNIAGFGHFTRDLRQDVTGHDIVSVHHIDEGACRQSVTLDGFSSFRIHDDTTGRQIFILVFDNGAFFQTGGSINLFAHRYAAENILQFHLTGDFRENGNLVKIPVGQQLAFPDGSFFPYFQGRAKWNHMVLHGPSFFVINRDLTATVQDDQFLIAVLDQFQIMEPHNAVLRRFDLGLFQGTAGGAAHVEGPEGQLRPRFADGLGGDDANRFTDLDQPAVGHIHAIALRTDAAFQFAG